MDLVSLEAPSRHIAQPRLPPAFWAAWLARQSVPRHASAPWLTAQQRLVVLAPHPDDEVLACGALLHGHVARGGTALVVAVTDGEGSHAGDARWTPDRLAARRRAESASGLQALGAGQVAVRRLGLADGGVAAARQRLQARLEALLQPGDVLATTWRRDGHPDHEACGAVAADVCAARGCCLLEAPVWMWHWGAPTHPDIPWVHLCAVAVAPQALACKRRAIAAHASQRAPRGNGRGPVLDAAILERAGWDAEYFFVSGDRRHLPDGRPVL